MIYLKLYENFNFNEEDFDFEEEPEIPIRYKNEPNFYHFLVDNNILTKWENNIIKQFNDDKNRNMIMITETIEDFLNDTPTREFLNYSFYWDGTPEGISFWSKLNDKWKNINKQNTNESFDFNDEDFEYEEDGDNDEDFDFEQDGDNDDKWTLRYSTTSKLWGGVLSGTTPIHFYLCKKNGNVYDVYNGYTIDNVEMIKAPKRFIKKFIDGKQFNQYTYYYTNNDFGLAQFKTLPKKN